VNLSPIIREAVRRVRDSDDFLLLDCLELLDRRKTHEPTAVGTMRWAGRSLIGYATDGAVEESEADCPACEGFGELDAEGANGRSYSVRCPECDGDCTVDFGDDTDEVPREDLITWRTLNGIEVDMDFGPFASVHPKWHDFHAAQRIVDKAKASLAAAKQAEAA
jgi:hypothetical protein